MTAGGKGMTEQHDSSQDDTSQESEQQGHHYDKLAARAQELFKAGKEKSREAMESAIEKARKQLTESGIFSSERGKALKENMLKDLERISAFSSELGGEARKKLDPARLGTGALASLSSLLHMAGDAIRGLAEKTDRALACRTGEVTSAGTLTCEKCGKSMRLKKSGHVPPCPGCSGTQFKKGY